eukprot:XP_001694889.1 predicted protein [Chlamydomonas reinhardtii]
MASYTQEDSSTEGRTVYAKPFPKSTTEEFVRDVFGAFGSILRVKLRREAVTNSFRGSVYVEYAEPSAAAAVVANPPQQRHSSSTSSAASPGRYVVMMRRKEKDEKERMQQRLSEAQQRAADAVAREVAASKQLLAKEAEVGALKGEISMLRTQGAAQLERANVAHKARVTELEGSRAGGHPSVASHGPWGATQPALL